LAKEIGDFDHPDKSRDVGGVREDIVELANATVGRIVHPVGWKWSEQMRPVVGTDRCQSRHMGLMLSGRLAIETAEGRIYEVAAGQVYNIASGHDAWVVGSEPAVTLEWVGQQEWLQPRHGERVLATLLFTDIVDSTRRAGELGDGPWRQLLTSHNNIVRGALSETHGTEIKHTGDGFLARFQGPAQALDAAVRIRQRMKPLELEVRQGVHVGEVEQVGDDLAGMAVHEAARVMSEAGAGEILVSELVQALTQGSGFNFEDMGVRELKGIEGGRRIYALSGT